MAIHEELMKIIKGRRSVRRYSEESSPLEDLKLLVDSARWAASGGNLQPWKFVIILDKKILKAVKMMAQASCEIRRPH